MIRVRNASAVRARRRWQRRRRRIRAILVTVLLLAGLFILLRFVITNTLILQSYDIMTGRLSQEVEEMRGLVEASASEHGIAEYVPHLLAIMEVETGGEAEDVMQSSESLGLEPNSLNRESSIDQGVSFFAYLLGLCAELGCDVNTAVQAYNYGPDFIYFISERGGLYSFELAEEFARMRSNGEQVNYINIISIKENGGWRYNYGNMFYARLVERFL